MANAVMASLATAKSIAREETLEANAAEDKRAGIAEAMMRLVGTGQANMGTLFKAMAISAPRSADLPGFAA